MRNFIFIILLLAGGNGLSAQSDPQLSLPWAIGDVWWLHHGPHCNNRPSCCADISTCSTADSLKCVDCDDSQNWSSIDLAPAPGYSDEVQAARGGFVLDQGCNVKVVIDHGDGWYTGYYHLDNIPAYIDNSNGTVFVSTGTRLGDASNRVDCGGSSFTPHVHFSLRYDGPEDHVRIWNRYIGGYWVEKGNYERQGKMTRAGLVSVQRPAGFNAVDPKSCMLNDGAIGWNTFSNKTVHINGLLGGEVDLVAISYQEITWTSEMRDCTIVDGGNPKGGELILISQSDIHLIGSTSDDLSIVKTYPNLPIAPYMESKEEAPVHGETENQENARLLIYPNPADEQITLQLQLEKSALCSASLYDINGRHIKELIAPQTLEQGEQAMPASVSGLESGVYLVRLMLAAEQITDLLVIRK